MRVTSWHDWPLLGLVLDLSWSWNDLRLHHVSAWMCLCQSPLNVWKHMKCNCVKIISADIDNDCNWRNDLHNILCIFTYCGCRRMQRLHNAITRRRRSTLPDYDIDHILKLSVSLWRRPRSNSIVSEMKRGWMMDGGWRGAEFKSKTQEEGGSGVEGVVLVTIHHFLYPPVGARIKGCVHFAFPLDSEWRN